MGSDSTVESDPVCAPWSLTPVRETFTIEWRTRDVPDHTAG